MYGVVTPVLLDKWGPPTADAVWVGGRVYLKQILQAFPLSPLLLPRFYFFALLFTSHRSPLSQRLEQARICMDWEKTYCFCNVRKWKDFSKKKKNSSPYIKCASVTSLLYGPWTNLWLFSGLYCQRFSHYIHKFHSPHKVIRLFFVKKKGNLKFSD